MRSFIASGRYDCDSKTFEYWCNELSKAEDQGFPVHWQYGGSWWESAMLDGVDSNIRAQVGWWITIMTWHSSYQLTAARAERCTWQQLPKIPNNSNFSVVIDNKRLSSDSDWSELWRNHNICWSAPNLSKLFDGYKGPWTDITMYRQWVWTNQTKTRPDKAFKYILKLFFSLLLFGSKTNQVLGDPLILARAPSASFPIFYYSYPRR